MSVVADIVKVEAPSKAVSGDTVIVDVSVKNLGFAPGGYNYITVTGVFDSQNLSWQFNYLYVAPQEIVVFRGWFAMPPRSVRLSIWSWYWDGANWVLDETNYIDISLTELVSAFTEFGVVSFNKA